LDSCVKALKGFLNQIKSICDDNVTEESEDQSEESDDEHNEENTCRRDSFSRTEFQMVLEILKRFREAMKLEVPMSYHPDKFDDWLNVIKFASEKSLADILLFSGEESLKEEELKVKESMFIVEMMPKYMDENFFWDFIANNCSEFKLTEEMVEKIAKWNENVCRNYEVRDYLRNVIVKEIQKLKEENPEKAKAYMNKLWRFI